MSSPSAAKVRQALQKRGFTRLPVCPHCLKEISLLDYARHTRECEKAVQKPSREAEPPALGRAIYRAAPPPSSELAPRLINALFSATARARLERAGMAIAEVRAQLQAERPRPLYQHDSATGQCVGCRYAWKADHQLQPCPDCGHIHPPREGCAAIRRAL